MRKLRIAAGGTAGNMPQIGHLALLKLLMNMKAVGLKEFDLVFCILSGESNQKNHKILAPPDDRIAMMDLMIPRYLRIATKPDLIVRYDDAYSINSPTAEWIARIQHSYPGSEITWYTGADPVVPRAEFNGKSEIEAQWYRGEHLFRNQRFLVVPRPGLGILPKELPPNFQVINTLLPGISSSMIRELIAEGKPFEQFVPRAVAQYIKTHGLYGYKEKNRG